MKHARLLLVDDDPVIRGIVAAFLRQQGAEVQECPGVPEANRALAAGDFDLILSDVHLPGNARLQWTEALLNREDAPPIVLITGNPEVESAMRAANLPVSGYLTKPPNFAELAEKLHACILAHQRRKSLRALAREAARQAATATRDGTEALAMQLEWLATQLEENAGSTRTFPGTPSPCPAWRSAIIETIAVLEKTKDSFRSMELGRLRQRLQQVLQSPAEPSLSAL